MATEGQRISSNRRSVQETHGEELRKEEAIDYEYKDECLQMIYR